MDYDIKIIPSPGKQGDSFVGLKINNNRIEFHYPETFRLSSPDDKKEIRKDILSVLNSISLAKTKSDELSYYNTEFSKDNTMPLESYLWIINDYLTYGRYENREKKYVSQIEGRVNWKKTFRQNPIISNGNIVYSNVISEKKEQKDNIITEIYRCCVKMAIDSIGWIYGLVFDSEGTDYDSLIKRNREYYIRTVSDEFGKSFDDTKKIRLTHMRQILTGLDEKLLSTREMTYGVDSYDFVFEKMIDGMFSNVDDIRMFYPNASVFLRMENRTVDSSNLRPDTIVIDEGKKNVYIVDAKNYRYGVTFNAKDIPETTSIQKQVTYGEYIKKMYDGEYNNIYSAFIMPYDKVNNIYSDQLNENIAYVAKSFTKWYDDDGSKNRTIVNLLIDMKYLIDNWNVKNNRNHINELIDKIEENI